MGRRITGAQPDCRRRGPAVTSNARTAERMLRRRDLTVHGIAG
jgi:hypothetical protein